MKRLTLALGILFASLAFTLHAQIETITIEDLGDTTLLDDSLHLARLAGITADGSLIALPGFCLDSSGCFWIKDTFGIKRAKIVVDSSEISFFVIINNKLTLIKKFNIVNNNFIFCGIQQFQWKFGNLFIKKILYDTLGFVHIIRDTSMGGSEFRIRYDPKRCIIETSSDKPGGITITQMLDSTGTSTTVRDSAGNEVTERIDPALCKKTLSTNKSAVSVMDIIDSTGHRRMVMDTSGNSMTDETDLANCKRTQSTSKTDVTVMDVIDSTGHRRMVMDTSGNAITEHSNPDSCEITRASQKSGSTAATTETTRFGPGGTTRTVSRGSGPSVPTVSEVIDALGQSVCMTGSSQCINYKIEGNLEVTKNITADSIFANHGDFLDIITGFLNAFFIQAENLLVTGEKNFAIPHPLDPENKYLLHSCIEGPERMNIYNGNIVTDQEGYASVQLPDYFMALNRDYKYNLTVVGKTFARAVVWEEMDEEGRFVIRTDEPGIKVSWQVTGTRQDEYARQHPYRTELTHKEFEERYSLNR